MVNLTYLSLTVKHYNEIVTVSHSQLLAEDGHFAVLAVSDEYRWLGRADHNRAILAFIDEALSNVIVHIKLAVVAEIYCKVFAIELARITVKEFALLFCKQKLSVSSSLCCPISVVPRLLLLSWRYRTLALSCCSWIGSHILSWWLFWKTFRVIFICQVSVLPLYCGLRVATPLKLV